MQKKQISGKSLLAALACVLATPGTAALAQGAGDKNSQDTTSLETIVVTAQKISENIQTVPVSVTPITATELAQHHIIDASQLVATAPTLQFQSFNAAPGGINFAVRGVGTLSFASSIDSSVTTVIDGVVMGHPEFGVMNFSDVAQVEVLNGPQGMLFGKNSSAGLVNITTNAPKIGTFSVDAHAEYGQMTTPKNGSITNDQATVNIPISSDSALRINAFYSHNDPLMRDVTPNNKGDFGQTEFGTRVKYLWDVSDKLTVTLGADVALERGVGPGATSDRALDPFSPYNAQNAAVGIVAGPENSYLSSENPTTNHFTVGGAYLNANYDLGDGYTLTNITAYRQYYNKQQFDVDDHQIDLFSTNKGWQNYYQITEELRVASPTTNKLAFQAGLYIYHDRVSTHADVYGAFGGLFGPASPGKTAVYGLTSDTIAHAESYALFGQATYNITESARLIFGARETYDDKSTDRHSDSTPYDFSLGLYGNQYRSFALTHWNTSWRVIGQYDLTDNAMAYASYTRGYKGPGFNVSFDISAKPVAPEIPSNIEIGVKSRMFDGRLQVNASAFSEKFQNFQAQSFDPTTTSFILLNAGRLDTQGVEADISAIPLDNLTVHVGVAYVDAVFGSFVGDQCWNAVADTKCVGGVHDSTGNRLPNAPMWTETFSAEYRHSLIEGFEAFVSGSLYSKSKVNYSSNGDPGTTLGSYVTADASLGIGPTDDNWEIMVFCRNCTDKRLPTFIQQNPITSILGLLDYGQQFGVGSYRTIGVSLDLHY